MNTKLQFKVSLHFGSSVIAKSVALAGQKNDYKIWKKILYQLANNSVYYSPGRRGWISPLGYIVSMIENL